MSKLCPTCGGGVFPGRQITDCVDPFHGEKQKMYEVHEANGRRFYGGPQCKCPTCKENQAKIRELEREGIRTAGKNVDLTVQTIIRFTELEMREALIEAAHDEYPDHDASECAHPTHCVHADLDNIIRNIITKRPT
jgi:hypothetical protein